MRRPVPIVIALAALSIGVATPARAEAPVDFPAPSQAPAATTPANLLAAADTAVDAGNLELARSLFERLVAEHPGAPEASEARRALKILTARARAAAGVVAPQPPARPATAPDEPVPSDGVVVRQEPYSLKTSERLRLTTWEKLDFGVTAFLYGMSVGFSYSLSLDQQRAGDVLPPIAIGALVYTLGAVAFLNLAHPDRGDLPLALGITSTLPTTTLLVANVAFDHPDARKIALATAAAGLISVPAAVMAAHELNLDPGDTQLVRDCGFWGLLLATTGTLGFGGSTDMFGYYSTPSSHSIATAGLLGLYGSLGLGAVAAAGTEISLERVRVTTWGGYGGAILGVLLGAAAGSNNGSLSTRDSYRGLTVGALAGLTITFLASSGLDGIPPEDAPAPRAAAPRLVPTLLPVAGLDGQPRPMLGLSGTLD
jgi:hypothetical protein